MHDRRHSLKRTTCDFDSAPWLCTPHTSLRVHEQCCRSATVTTTAIQETSYHDATSVAAIAKLPARQTTASRAATFLSIPPASTSTGIPDVSMSHVSDDNLASKEFAKGVEQLPAISASTASGRTNKPTRNGRTTSNPSALLVDQTYAKRVLPFPSGGVVTNTALRDTEPPLPLRPPAATVDNLVPR